MKTKKSTNCKHATDFIFIIFLNSNISDCKELKYRDEKNIRYVRKLLIFYWCSIPMSQFYPHWNKWLKKWETLHVPFLVIDLKCNSFFTLVVILEFKNFDTSLNISTCFGNQWNCEHKVTAKGDHQRRLIIKQNGPSIFLVTQHRVNLLIIETRILTLYGRRKFHLQ